MSVAAGTRISGDTPHAKGGRFPLARRRILPPPGRRIPLWAVGLVTAAWLAAVLPLVLMVVHSFSPGGVFPVPAGLSTGGGWHWDNYVQVWQRNRFGSLMANSLSVAAFVVGGQLLTSSVMGYLFARVPFPGRNLLFSLYLLSMLVPDQLTLVPSFRLLTWLGLVDTRGALIVPFLAGALGTLIMRQQFLALPRELEDAALLDGAGRWAMWRHVLLPLVAPGLRAVAVLVFLFCWNDLLWPLVMTHRLEVRTLPVGLALLKDDLATRWPLLMAGCVMATVPALIIVGLCTGGFRRMGVRLWEPNDHAP